MRNIILVIMITAFTLTTVSCVTPETYQPLRENSLFSENIRPPVARYTGAGPGANELLPRGFEGAPPQIPHDISDFVIAKDNNDCLMCHGPAAGMAAVPQVSKKHLSENGKLSMDRYLCSQCHVPLADVKPLVENENDRFIVTGSRVHGSRFTVKKR